MREIEQIHKVKKRLFFSCGMASKVQVVIIFFKDNDTKWHWREVGKGTVVSLSECIPGKIFTSKLRLSRCHWQKKSRDVCVNTLPLIELAVSGARSR